MNPVSTLKNDDSLGIKLLSFFSLACLGLLFYQLIPVVAFIFGLLNAIVGDIQVTENMQSLLDPYYYVWLVVFLLGSLLTINSRIKSYLKKVSDKIWSLLD